MRNVPIATAWGDGDRSREEGMAMIPELELVMTLHVEIAPPLEIGDDARKLYCAHR